MGVTCDMPRIEKFLTPKNETIWVRYYDAKNNLRFMVTSKQSRDNYFLYEINDGKANKIGRAISPKDFENKHKILENLK